MSIRILIADDHKVLRSGLRALFSAEDDLEVVAEAADGRETLRLAATCSPDLVLLDISMPGESGIDVARHLKEQYPGIAILFLTMHEDESLLQEALKAGAAGYVIKRADDREIVLAVRAASRGDLYIHPAMTRALLSSKEKAVVPDRSLPEPLTRREIEVLRLLARGCTNRQIAEAIGISIRTAEGHRANVMGKLGVTSRVELVTYAEQHGLLAEPVATRANPASATRGPVPLRVVPGGGGGRRS